MRALALVALIGLAAGMPRPLEDEVAPLRVRQERQAPFPFASVPIVNDFREGPDKDGNFKFRYETGDGIVHDAQGTNAGDGIVRVSGSYSYVSPEGETVSVTYTADENGFRAFRTGAQAPSPFLPFSVDTRKDPGPPLDVFHSPVEQESGGRDG